MTKIKKPYDEKIKNAEYLFSQFKSELFEQSKKRVHRIGTTDKCTYYKLVSGIEYGVYNALDMRKDYTDQLFMEETDNDK